MNIPDDVLPFIFTNYREWELLRMTCHTYFKLLSWDSKHNILYVVDMKNSISRKEYLKLVIDRTKRINAYIDKNPFGFNYDSLDISAGFIRYYTLMGNWMCEEYTHDENKHIIWKAKSHYRLLQFIPIMKNDFPEITFIKVKDYGNIVYYDMKLITK